MIRPCHCDKPTCPFCFHWARTPSFRGEKDSSDRKKGRKTPVELATEAAQYPCPKRSIEPVPDESADCRTCKKISLAVYSCSVFGRCTIERPSKPGKDGKNLGWCKTCDHRPLPHKGGLSLKELKEQVKVTKVAVVNDFPAITRRNLLYHVYPRRGGDWRTPVNRIRGCIDLFNGTKTVAIAYDDTTEHPVMVEDALSGLGIKFIRVANDPNLREVATFLPLFESVAVDTDPGSATLYGHAKGVTRSDNLDSIKRWADTLADVCLNYWPVVNTALRSHPVAGPFKKLGKPWKESVSQWHFSGSWFWFRNAQLFSKDWRKIDQFWSGIEPYPSLHFTADEAASLFHNGTVGEMNLYRKDYWDTVIDPALSVFRNNHESSRTGLVTPPAGCSGLNFGCGPHYKSGWMNVDISPSVKTDAVITGGVPVPFPTAAFDRAYLGHVLEHVRWEECVPLLEEIRRVVRPGGEVCCVGPDIFKAVHRAVESGGADADMRHVAECGEWQEFDGEPGRDHRWACSEKRLVMLLERAGFKNVQAVPMSDLTASWPVVSTDGAQSGAIGAVP